MKKTLLLGMFLFLSLGIFGSGSNAQAGGYFKMHDSVCSYYNSSAGKYEKSTVLGPFESDVPTNFFNSTASGVFVNCTQPGFAQYLEAFLAQNFSIVLFSAFIMVIFSGIEYMNSGFNPSLAGKAKTRIIGILTGLVFYLLINLIINQLSPDLTNSTIAPKPTAATEGGGK